MWKYVIKKKTFTKAVFLILKRKKIKFAKLFSIIPKI